MPLDLGVMRALRRSGWSAAAADFGGVGGPVPGSGALPGDGDGDVDTEHLQLSMEPWRSPQGIVGDHLRYQPTNRERGRRSPTGVAFRRDRRAQNRRKRSRSQRTTLSA